MANLCNFQMMVKGSKEGIDKFYDALTQENHECWMGRGAEADIYYEDGVAEIDGYCKWSIQSALIDNATSMEVQRTTGNGMWGGIEGVKKFLTLFEACERFHVNMEVFSFEPGCCFSEHYKYENGEILDECCDYFETWNEETEDYDCEGGFTVKFDLADVA